MTKDEAYYGAIDLLEALIATPSVSRNEEQAATLIEETLTAHGITPHRIGNNVWAQAKSTHPALPTLLLNSHIDTVKPVATWTYPPQRATRIGDRIYGLGSNDAGGALVSLLYTFIYLLEQEETARYNLLFLASCEEEVAGIGGARLALPQLPSFDCAIVGEPTGMQPAIAEKGLMVLDCVVKGVSGHAAREEGENAIYKAMPIIEAFRALSFPKTSSLLGKVKATVTLIEAGTQHNVIPDSCRFTVDVRTNDCYSNEEALAYIRSQISCEMTPRSLHLNSSAIDPRHPLVERCKLLGLTPYGSPTMSDQAHLSVPSFKMGPGASERSHSADEYIDLPEIRTAIELYIQLLE